MAIQSLCPAITLPDPAADRKTARRVEQYRLSEQAIYIKAFPGDKYLPFTAVRRAWTQKSSMPLTGCCGKELPVVVLRVRYEGGFYQNFTFENQRGADQVLEAVARACPDTPLTPEERSAVV